jgi:hypothetical protein
MLNHRSFLTIGLSLWLLGTSGCGGADTKEPESGAAAKKNDQAAAGESKGGASKEKASAEPQPEAAAEPTTKRSPKDIITAPDVVFVLAFAKSEVGEEAQQACAKKAKDDRKQKACMEKERKKVTSDMVSFAKDKKGKWWWMTARMQGAKLTYLHKVAIEFGEEKADSISIKPLGKDKGKKPWKQVPDKLTISVPDEFSIVLTDPTYGKMVFEAKIGIAGHEG